MRKSLLLTLILINLFNLVTGKNQVASTVSASYNQNLNNSFNKLEKELNESYYSFNLRNWHFIVLNSNCSEVSGCIIDASQLNWLKQDLISNSSKCTFVYWNQAQFSSSTYQNDPKHKAFWEVLYENHTDIVLSRNVYNHTYKRLIASKDELDTKINLQVFSLSKDNKLFDLVEIAKDNTLLIRIEDFGALHLTLYETSYVWWFEPITEMSFRDIGATMCH